MDSELGSNRFIAAAYDAELYVAGVLDPLGVMFAPVPVSGDVGIPCIYNLPCLPAAETQSASYTAAGAPVSDSYTGVALWNVLQDAGGVRQGAARNDILSKFVVATGADGYAAVFSLGEIDPAFGNGGVTVAYADSGGQLGPSGPDGLARVVVPGDAAGGRYVSDLASLRVGSLPEPAPTGAGGISGQLTLSGAVTTPETVTPDILAALNQSTTVTATYLAGSGQVTDTYTGVSLWTLIQDDGLLTDPSVKNDILRYGVIATGSDGYRALISLGEIDPVFGGRTDLVAYADTGGQLGPGGADGALRLVVPGDAAGGRYVSNLVGLQVVNLDPAPHGIT